MKTLEQRAKEQREAAASDIRSAADKLGREVIAAQAFGDDASRFAVSVGKKIETLLDGAKVKLRDRAGKTHTVVFESPSPNDSVFLVTNDAAGNMVEMTEEGMLDATLAWIRGAPAG
ncbi:hypothetical protein [Tardiphaga sp. P9-11]|uniref:hypothetical protein n=1 Tax=Tardiphaga sp. P9-11 TaxID=2024614 RepID=UPI0011F18C8D|nr:hypothetical protein [Tardiphaga sp. P9-11]KAA0076122.1 hypothetical protein CIW50_07625 [Tardiphaga sp. P9-11]